MEDNVSSGLTTVHALVPYPRNSTTPVLPPYFSTPAIPFAPTLSKKDPPSWDTDIFMPKNESSRAPDNEIDDAEKEIKDFKKFSVMSKQMLNCPKVALQNAQDFGRVCSAATDYKEG